MRKRSLTTTVGAVGAVLAMAACGSPAAPSTTTSSAAPSAAASPASAAPSASGGSAAAGGGDAKTATSAADLGGMSGLEAACKKEGKLNVIALPPDWANYGQMIDDFKKKYGVTVNSAQPDANSQDEINAANQLKGTDRAPDVFDLGTAVALANTTLYAPYKVATFDKIPAQFKESTGLWVNDYGGFMSVGYDAKKVPAPTKLDDLLGDKYKGKVALNGDPTKASAGFNGVMLASLASGGSADDISKGVEWFKKLKAAGNFLPVDPTPATIASGQTPVVFDWDYLQAAQVEKLKAKGIDWKVWIPDGALVAGYYIQAINKDAPNPACARLWQEYLYSPDGQNTFLKGFARPVLFDQMTQDGTIDKDAAAKLPPAKGTAVVQTQDQIKAGQDYLKANWAKAIG